MRVQTSQHAEPIEVACDPKVCALMSGLQREHHVGWQFCIALP